MEFFSSRGAGRCPRLWRWAAAMLAAAMMLSAATGVTAAGTGILIGDPEPKSDAVHRIIDGEGTRLSAESEPRRFYVELMLMRAQMRLGRELYRVGERDAGRAHFIAPAEAHLPAVRDSLMDGGWNVWSSGSRILPTPRARPIR